MDTRVLLAEDNPVNAKLAQRFFEKLGCRVEVAGDGRQAIALLQQNSPDIVFMDCQMPEMDGFDACAAIRRWEAEHGRARVPIIALTGNAEEGDRDRCLKAGMDDYLTKPIALEALRAMLAKWVRPPVSQ